MTGSHIDTQPIGGMLDGAYGVVGALEVIAALNDAGVRTRRPIEVVIWTNEEGCRFSPGTMGSSAFANPALMAGYRLATDCNGVSFGQALGTVFDSFPGLPIRALGTPVAAYVELHIEQGPVLERAGTSLGVVTGIQGVRWYRVGFTGTAAHAGTTPMDERRDAMHAAVELAQQLYAMAAAEAASGLRLTLGHWEVQPNSVNTIPASALFTIDVRCPDETVLERFDNGLQSLALACGKRAPAACELFFARAPTVFPEATQAAVERACRRAKPGTTPLRLVSGAFHDAMHLAGQCPTGMIFVPSRGGISHNAAEETAPHDLFLGVRALAHTIAELANQ
jgi:N-carbamoyl-L-amino-acid hydrolase